MGTCSWSKTTRCVWDGRTMRVRGCLGSLPYRCEVQQPTAVEDLLLQGLFPAFFLGWGWIQSAPQNDMVETILVLPGIFHLASLHPSLSPFLLSSSLSSSFSHSFASFHPLISLSTICPSIYLPIHQSLLPFTHPSMYLLFLLPSFHFFLLSIHLHPSTLSSFLLFMY